MPLARGSPLVNQSVPWQYPFHQKTCKLSNEYDRLRVQQLSKKYCNAKESAKRAAANARIQSTPARAPLSAMVIDPPLGLEFAEPQSTHDIERDPLDEPASLGRGQCKKRPTWKVIEQNHAIELASSTQPPTQPLPAQALMPQFGNQTSQVDRYGLYAKYLSPIPATMPTHFTPTPIHFIEPTNRVPEHLRNRAIPVSPPADNAPIPSPLPPPHLGFSSPSAELVMNWHWSSKTKSLEDTNKLVHSVICQVKASELANFDAR
ncbi:hypothetical protein QCA50_014934 [Cerrena zonata]|uniref:Uncharacterized protein n=1 Tax=Cerrena zonata TaxID=2478898 RepID=A0AAW0FMC5_9APHY